MSEQCPIHGGVPFYEGPLRIGVPFYDDLDPARVGVPFYETLTAGGFWRGILAISDFGEQRHWLLKILEHPGD